MKRSRKDPKGLFERGDVKQAERRCKAILRKQPRHPAALNLMGCIRMRHAQVDEAARFFEQAIAVEPLRPEYHENLAEVYLRRGSVELAEAECRLALRAEQQRPRAVHLLGKIALERRDYTSALEHLSSAIALETPNVDAMIDVAAVLNRVGKPEMAVKYATLVLRLVPDHPAALINLGMAHRAMHQLEAAKTAFTKAGNTPMACFNLGYVHMLEDDLASGLPLMEARKELLGIGKALAKPEWLGKPTRARTLLVVGEQGFGDAILISRFYPTLFEHFERVALQVPEPLARLMKQVDARLEVVTSVDDAEYDTWCGNMSVPLALGVNSVDQIPVTPWLAVPRTDTGRERLRIGINWAGNPSYAYDAVRSARLDEFQMFFDVPGIEWVSLHKGHREHEAEQFGLPQPLRDARDFYDTAQIIAGLDLVISTETAIPNLSAAMGVRTCVLTGATTDWRWKSWYANVTICHQHTIGNWFGAIATALEVIKEELVACASVR